MNGNVAVLPKKRRPAANKSPDSPEPTIGEWRSENWPVGMIVKVYADVDPGNPAQHRSRSQHECDAGPWPRDAGHAGMQVQPECAAVCRDADEMKNHAVPVLGMGEHAPAPTRREGIACEGAQIILSAAAIARTVAPRLTQGPQSAAPAIITIAKSGKKDRPNASPVRERNVCDRRAMVRSFPLRLGCARYPEQLRRVSAR
jgi:hypothetical protein